MKPIFVSLVVMLCTACSGVPLTADRYNLYSGNISILNSLDMEPINIGLFSSSFTNPVEIFGNEISPTGHGELRCLVDAYITPPDAQTFSNFIRSSLVFELTNANLYTSESPITLTGDLQELNFSFEKAGFGNGSVGGTWSFRIEITSSNGKSKSITSSYSYETAYKASSCDQMAGSMMPAIQNLISEILTNEMFPSLLSAD
jgi:hypothetical protein